MPTKRNAKQQMPKKVGFGESIANFFSKYAMFSGTTSRSEFWFAWLFLFIILCPIMFFLFGGLLSEDLYLIALGDISAFLFIAVMFVPMYSLLSRRCHDAGVSGVVAIILMIVNFLSLLFGLLIIGLEEEIPDFASSMEAFLDIVDRGTSVVYLIIGCLPSKFKDNPYRK